VPHPKPTRSPAESSTAPADRPTPVRPHVVDRALAVHRLRAEGHTNPEVQRRLGVSKSSVSVLGYLGAALAGMEPDSVAELRTPAVTARAVWALATRARSAERATRRDARAGDDGAAREADRRRAVVALRAALRDHLVQARLTERGGAGRRHTAGRRATDRSAAARAIGWTHAAWADDPVAFTDAHLAALAAAHAHVAERAARAVALAGAEHALAGQVAAAGAGSLSRLGGARWRALAAAARGARTPAEDRALAALAVVTRALREAQDAVARLRPTPTASPAIDGIGVGGEGAVGGAPDAPDPVQDAVRWEDVEEDLRD
jgi:hypothetical protein